MAASNTLSDKAIQATIKAVKIGGKARKISDGGGLVLDVRPTGSGWWRMRYWQEGREGMLSLGTYPVVSLAEARARRDDARKLIATGADPSVQRKLEKQAKVVQAEADRAEADGHAMPGSFEAVAREWLTTVHEAKVSESHAARTLARFENDVFPWLGARPIAQIEPPELLAMLRRIEARGAYETTHRAKDACGQVFRYGIAAGHCTRNPAADLRDALKPVPVRHFAAITDPLGVGELLRDLADYGGHPVTRAALTLSALLLLRPGELRQLEWSWIDFESVTLTIPAELMKRTKDGKANGVPHVVPLAPQAIATLRNELEPLTGHGRYVFPSQLTDKRPMSGNTVRSALRRLGYGNDDMTAHGFRAVARTLIAERLNVAPDVIEAQLAHGKSGPLGAAYDRAQYLEQRRQMMTAWAGYVDKLRRGAEVVQLRPAA